MRKHGSVESGSGAFACKATQSLEGTYGGGLLIVRVPELSRSDPGRIGLEIPDDGVQLVNLFVDRIAHADAKAVGDLGVFIGSLLP